MAMKRWQEDYITCLISGKDPEVCARRCAGLPLAMVMEHVEEDPEFREAWEKALPKDGSTGLVGTRRLSPAGLEKVLYGQATDEEAAAYFGLTVDELMAAIDADERLQRVYKFSRTGGKAEIKVAQHEKAISGDASMLTWMGKNYLGQADKVDVTRTGGGADGAPVTINNIILRELTDDQLERMLDQSRGIGTELVIEGTAVRVESDATPTQESEEAR